MTKVSAKPLRKPTTRHKTRLLFQQIPPWPEEAGRTSWRTGEPSRRPWEKVPSSPLLPAMNSVSDFRKRQNFLLREREFLTAGVRRETQRKKEGEREGELARGRLRRESP